MTRYMTRDRVSIVAAIAAPLAAAAILLPWRSSWSSCGRSATASTTGDSC